MTDQELFEKLKRNGECWITGEIIRSRCFGKDPDTGESNSCHTTHDPADQNPDFSTPDGFFWLWERAQKKEWFVEFLHEKTYVGNSEAEIEEDWLCIKKGLIDFINPTRFTEALKQYLSEVQDSRP